MGKLGAFSYPEIPLSEAVEIAERIAKDYRGQITKSGLAKALGMAERGGGFASKMAALKDFRLADGRGELRLTTLGQRAALPRSQDERISACREAFLSVDLFQRLSERIGDSMPDHHSFAIHLEEITGADRLDVEKRGDKIYKLYSDSARLFPTVSVPGEAPAMAGIPRRPHGAEVGRATPEDFIELSSGPTHLKLAKSKTNIDIIIAALQAMKAELESGEE